MKEKKNEQKITLRMYFYNLSFVLDIKKKKKNTVYTTIAVQHGVAYDKLNARE